MYWKGQEGDLWQVTRNQSGQWGSAARVVMGPLGGWPHATAQPDGETEVFWRHQGMIMDALLTAGGDWSGPFGLGGETSESPPVPVSASKLVHVLFVGSDSELWQSVRNAAGQWHGPSQLLPGPLTATPFAGIRPNKARIDVFWKDDTGQLWWASVSSKGHPTSPRVLGHNAG